MCQNCYKKVSEKEIKEYYKHRSELEGYFKNGKCKDAKEERLLRTFQNEKNHIELMEVAAYAEIVNDFMGQLISWAYLRERDLMYFQLSYHYMRLFYSSCVEEDSFLRQMEGDGIHIRKNVVLYQIIAMYTYEMPVLIRDGSGKAQKDVRSGGNSVTQFYKGYCQDHGEIYESGLELFENIKNGHDEVVNIRNYIDHFKY